MKIESVLCIIGLVLLTIFFYGIGLFLFGLMPLGLQIIMTVGLSGFFVALIYNEAKKDVDSVK